MERYISIAVMVRGVIMPSEKNSRLKKCEKCDATTNTSREDFSTTGWAGFQIGNNKMKCLCPIHNNPKVMAEMIKDGVINANKK